VKVVCVPNDQRLVLVNFKGLLNFSSSCSKSRHLRVYSC